MKENQALHVKALGLHGEKAAIVRNYLTEIGNNQKAMQYLAEQFRQFGFADTDAYKNKDEASATVRKITFGLLQSLYRRGLIKLPTNDMEEFYVHQIRVSKHYSSDACRSFHLGTPSVAFSKESKTFEQDILRKMSTVEVRKLYSHLLKAQMAALDETKPRRDLKSNERELATKAYEHALVKGLQSLPENEARRIANTLLDLHSASGKDVCDASIFMFTQVLSATGQARDWIFRLNMESIQ